MTDAAPKRIWAAEIGTTTKGGQRFRIGRWITDETKSHPNEYILASEHAALIREAEARGMERAAEICEVIRTSIANGPMPEGARFDYEQAIRAAKATP